ncbi:ATP-binding cassette domain-containing protein [Actinomadura vinacea]
MGVRRGGRWLLRPVAFGIAEGVIGLAGPPGVGKSTLLATFATLRRPHAGALRILGHDIGKATDLRAVRARIGFLPGRFRWAKNMTAEELVEYAAYYKKVRAPAARNIMKRLDVADAGGTELALLPPDVRLRAGLAAACVHGPELVVLDDPLEELYEGRGAADRAAVAELIPLIRALAPTVVVSAARPEHLASWCREVYTLARGRLTEHRPAEHPSRAPGRLLTAGTAPASVPASMSASVSASVSASTSTSAPASMSTSTSTSTSTSMPGPVSGSIPKPRSGSSYGSMPPASESVRDRSSRRAPRTPGPDGADPYRPDPYRPPPGTPRQRRPGRGPTDAPGTPPDPMRPDPTPYMTIAMNGPLPPPIPASTPADPTAPASLTSSMIPEGPSIPIVWKTAPAPLAPVPATAPAPCGPPRIQAGRRPAGSGAGV